MDESVAEIDPTIGFLLLLGVVGMMATFLYAIPAAITWALARHRRPSAAVSALAPPSGWAAADTSGMSAPELEGYLGDLRASIPEALTEAHNTVYLSGDPTISAQEASDLAAAEIQVLQSLPQAWRDHSRRQDTVEFAEAVNNALVRMRAEAAG